MTVHGCESPADAGAGDSCVHDIGAIFRQHGDAYRAGHAVGAQASRALRAIGACRTSVLGGHVDTCATCGHQRPSYNSCRNRHCPKCQALRQARWVTARMDRALPVPHFHVVFTLPAQLRALVAVNPVPLLDLLFRCAAETLLTLGRDPNRLGGTLGITAVLHTWGRNLVFHPHLHCIVTGGGLAADGRWIRSRERHLLPVRVLGALFRGKYLDGLRRLHRDGGLVFKDGAAALAVPGAFQRLLDELYARPWIVYAKAPFAGAKALFRYLGRYTHRVAISNHRLLHVDDNRVVFRTRGQATCTLVPTEFIRRFLLHVLPRGFVKIRHFGLLAPSQVNSGLVAARTALADAARPPPVDPTPAPPSTPATWQEILRQLTGIDLHRCTSCGGAIVRQPLSTPALPAQRGPPPGTA